MFPKSSATTITGRDINHQVFLNTKKLVLVSATSTPVTKTREKTVETAKTVEIAKTVETAEAVEFAEVGKDGAESKGEYPNLVRVLFIQYPITF